nr:hypothetical protein [Rhodococcus sp. 15-1154-1]
MPPTTATPTESTIRQQIPPWTTPREVIQAAAGWLGDVDETIFELTSWSPLTEVTTPLSGNWNEIRRAGETFDIAGSAMEAAAASLERGVRRVDDYWDGQAAQAFTEYSGRQIAAMYWEGSCGRTIHAISEAIAEEIREGVQTVVRKFAEVLEAEVDLGSGSAAMKVALEKVPVLGTAWQLGAIVDILRQTLDLTMDLVRRIEELVDQFGCSSTRSSTRKVRSAARSTSTSCRSTTLWTRATLPSTQAKPPT